MFSHILVATDFSGPSAAALEYARTIATQFGASLHLLHVVEDPYRASYSAEVYVPELTGICEDLVADAISKLDDRLLASDSLNLRVTTDAVVGTPAWAIVEYAAAREIDLIVMGTHGRSGMSHLLMGSVAEKVVRAALCPVLTVREALVRAERIAAEPIAIKAPPVLARMFPAPCGY